MSLGDGFIVVLITVVAFILFCFAFRYFWRLSLAKKTMPKKKPAVKGRNMCPVCHSSLDVGENINSRVYKEANSREQSCTIHGCPHCYPKAEFGIKRECPVCHKTVPQEGHLRAILFTRENEKKHVHIVGCTECQRKCRL